MADLSTEASGCSAENITIRHVRGGGLEGPTSWVAQCGGNQWFCSVLHKQAICTDVPPNFDWGNAGETGQAGVEKPAGGGETGRDDS